MPELVAGGRVLRYHTPRRWLHPPLSTPHARARRQRPCPPSSHRSSSPAAASVFTPELIAGGRVLCVLRYQRCLAAACVCSCSGNEKEDDTVVSGCRSLTFPKKKTISIRRSPPISNSLSSLLLHHRRRRRRSSPATATAAMNYIVGAFKPPCDISVAFSNARTRKQIAVKNDNGRTVMVPLFQSLETISGEVSVAPVPGKRIEHLGVKIELLGQIELYLERGKFYDFTSLGTCKKLP